MTFMIRVGDTVKVKSLKTIKEKNGKEISLYPIETICRVVSVCYYSDTENLIQIIPVYDDGRHRPYSYFEHEVEKGHVEWKWVKD